MSPEFSLPFWTICTGIVANAACALLGCYLVLRRMSMLGDAISHSVLPGIVVAILFSVWTAGGADHDAGGALASPGVFVGAVIAGLLTALLTQALHTYGGVPEDAAMGIVYTSFFAVGVLLITRFANQAHLDPDCLLYGQIESIPLDLVQVGPFEVPRAFRTLLPVCLGTIAVIVVFWKELQLAAFDGPLATSMGFSAAILHYGLMAMVAIVSVASFEAVGSILVIAMLIVPPATAQLLTDRLPRMLIISVLCGALAAILGYVAAAAWNTSVAGMMAVAAGAQFTLAVVFAPRHGLLTRFVGNLRLGVRIVREDILAVLYRVEERQSQGATGAPLSDAALRELAGGGWRARLALPILRWRGFVQDLPSGHRGLTPRGRERARALVRSHRLWEAYLDKHFDLPLDHLHEPASRVEHYITPEMQADLSAELDLPARDPHGRRIPPAAT